MTTPVMTDTSVGGWLLPTPGDTQVRIEKVVAQAAATKERARPLRTLGKVARRALAEEIEAKLRMVMSETLADLVMSGWRTYGAVTQAIRKSLSQPGVDQIVPLRRHTITATRQHNLDIEVDRFPVLALAAELVVHLNLYDAVAVVKDGRVAGIRSGQASVDGAVSVEGVEVSRKALVFPLTAELALHRSPAATAIAQ